MFDYEKERVEIDKVTKSLYRLICFPEGDKPDFWELKKIFMPGAKIINNNEGPIVLSVTSYIQRIKDMIKKGVLKSYHEKEISSKTDIFGDIAQRFSTYETRLNPEDEEPFQVGIHSIQFIKEFGKWRVVSMIWNNESGQRKIPKVYLP